MQTKYQLLRWDDAIARLEQIKDAATCRFIRRVATIAFDQFSSNPDHQVCDFDLLFLVTVLERTLRKKDMVIQELQGKECSDSWDLE